ncbi:hypothetical protein Q6670_004117 [Salmonella enterica]|nr:hypothetical protein [Salmonella enterica]
MTLLTHEAAEAIEWLRLRIPDRYFDSFRDEMETAMRDVLERYGFDQELVDGFGVKQLLARRIPINPASSPIIGRMTSVRVTMYVGGGRWAVDDNGKVYEQDLAGVWRASLMTLDEVKANSTTYSPTIIQIRRNAP